MPIGLAAPLVGGKEVTLDTTGDFTPLGIQTKSIGKNNVKKQEKLSTRHYARPGKAEGAEPGENISARRLYDFMQAKRKEISRQRKRKGQKELHKTYKFQPTTPGYIPFIPIADADGINRAFIIPGGFRIAEMKRQQHPEKYNGTAPVYIESKPTFGIEDVTAAERKSTKQIVREIGVKRTEKEEAEEDDLADVQQQLGTLKELLGREAARQASLEANRQEMFNNLKSIAKQHDELLRTLQGS
jgi:hypothetical protein